MTTEEIYNKIIAEKESGSYPELYELNSTSKVSIWRLWVWIFAFFSKTIRELFADLQDWVTDYFSKNQIGTLNWWISELKKFQYGDEVEFIKNKFQYAIIDAEKQIIQQAAIEVQNRVLLIKVAKLVSDELVPLSDAEKTALSGYIHKIKLPGTLTSIISQNAANIDLNLRIYYNAEILQATILSDIESQINEYLQTIVFNGKMVITELIDQLQTIEGVINPVFLSAEAQEEFSAETVEIQDYYISTAGYMTLRTLNIEWIENV